MTRLSTPAGFEKSVSWVARVGNVLRNIRITSIVAPCRSPSERELGCERGQCAEEQKNEKIVVPCRTLSQRGLGFEHGLDVDAQKGSKEPRPLQE